MNPTTQQMLLEKVVNSPKETRQVAHQFAGQLRPGDVVAFIGELGSGKTFFIKAVCEYFHVLEEASSPSFTIVNEYHTPEGLTLYHFDFYRLENPLELMNLGLEDYLYNEGICLIEWAEKVYEFLPAEFYEVHLDFVDARETARRIRISRQVSK